MRTASATMSVSEQQAAEDRLPRGRGGARSKDRSTSARVAAVTDPWPSVSSSGRDGRSAR